jgi:hypothetical protein
VGQLHGEPAQRQQVQACDECEGIQMQGRPHLPPRTVIRWRRDRPDVDAENGFHRLSSSVQLQTAPETQPILFSWVRKWAQVAQ